MWIPRVKLRSPGVAVAACTCWAMALPPTQLVFFFLTWWLLVFFFSSYFWRHYFALSRYSQAPDSLLIRHIHSISDLDYTWVAVLLSKHREAYSKQDKIEATVTGWLCTLDSHCLLQCPQTQSYKIWKILPWTFQSTIQGSGPLWNPCWPHPCWLHPSEKNCYPNISTFWHPSRLENIPMNILFDFNIWLLYYTASYVNIYI